MNNKGLLKSIIPIAFQTKHYIIYSKGLLMSKKLKSIPERYYP